MFRGSKYGANLTRLGHLLFRRLQKLHLEPKSVEQLVLESKSTNPQVLQRLGRVYELFSRKSDFHELRLACLELYGQNSLIEDIVECNNQDLLQFFCEHYFKSEPVQTLIDQNVVDLLRSGKTEVLAEFFRDLRVASAIPIDLDDLGRDSLANQFLQFVARSGYPLLSSLYMFQLGCQINNVTLIVLLENLCAAATFPHYNYYAIYRILRQYKPDLMPEHKAMVLRFLSSDKLVPFFGNMFYREYVSPNTELLRNREIQESVVRLITANGAKNNMTIVLLLWTDLLNHCPGFIPQKLPSLANLIGHLYYENPQRCLLFFSQFPKLLWIRDEILNMLLLIFSQKSAKEEDFRFVLDAVRAPLSNTTLSHLFAAFVARGDDQLAEKIVSAIMSKNKRLLPMDFSSMISRLISENKIVSALQYCTSQPFQLTRDGCLKLFEFFLYNEAGNLEDYKKLRWNFIEWFSQQLYNKNNKFLSILVTKVLFQWFVSQGEFAAARELFLARDSLQEKKPFQFSHYGLPWRFGKTVRIVESNRIDCLNIILSGAREAGKSAYFEWAVNYMRSLGLTKLEVLNNEQTRLFTKMMKNGKLKNRSKKNFGDEPLSEKIFREGGARAPKQNEFEGFSDSKLKENVLEEKLANIEPNILKIHNSS